LHNIIYSAILVAPANKSEGVSFFVKLRLEPLIHVMALTWAGRPACSDNLDTLSGLFFCFCALKEYILVWRIQNGNLPRWINVARKAHSSTSFAAPFALEDRAVCNKSIDFKYVPVYQFVISVRANRPINTMYELFSWILQFVMQDIENVLMAVENYHVSIGWCTGEDTVFRPLAAERFEELVAASPRTFFELVTDSYLHDCSIM
jgi:hypothetical protein